MDVMIKTNRKLCLGCKYHFGGNGNGSEIICDYYNKTGKRRNCPVGYCDKYEKGKNNERRVIPWSNEILALSAIKS